VRRVVGCGATCMGAGLLGDVLMTAHHWLAGPVVLVLTLVAAAGLGRSLRGVLDAPRVLPEVVLEARRILAAWEEAERISSSAAVAVPIEKA
jgi:hypothetical protein